MLFEVEAVLDDRHPDLRDENTADWLRRALRAREARAERAEAQRDRFARAVLGGGGNYEDRNAARDLLYPEAE